MELIIRDAFFYLELGPGSEIHPFSRVPYVLLFYKALKKHPHTKYDKIWISGNFWILDAHRPGSVDVYLSRIPTHVGEMISKLQA